MKVSRVLTDKDKLKNIIISLYVCLIREVIRTGARLLKEFMILMTYEGQHVTHGHERQSYIEGTQGVYATVYAVYAELSAVAFWRIVD